ncbi:hypothetical protein VC83_00769 [Pseudogymnoascus destructans]|uniref:Alcohol dehydrogenase-like C-terminal domain-containing protein n=2 Tax=Pseudogymnoascus destructans TaxID=655981 RepID=L8G6B7_PSED2|nr:uncharacterized protein VC83_00769 [Pseudogymnoascus destructans]ELR08795.1 hypothetical protein GMDG_03471 [Pseudogymnoascus destructans 20631-21]OAF62681.1 hypothetical protein VC83_00769 [Pseudogymnoascus destructans]
MMGATGFIATEDENWAKKNAGTLDLIISTVSSPNMPLSEYLALLAPKGHFIQVGAPEDVLPPINAFYLIVKGIKLGGSLIGTPQVFRQPEVGMKSADGQAQIPELVLQCDKGVLQSAIVISYSSS